jgi:hypothetical protein
MPYYGDSDKNYSFDEQTVVSLLAQRSTLLKVNCNISAVLKGLGLGSSKVTITSIGLDENDMSYSFDFTNCSLRGNKKDVQWSNKDITEDRGMMTAKSFLKSSKLKNRVFNPLGDPMIIAKNTNGGITPMYRTNMMMNKGATATEDNYPEIEIDENDTGNVDLTYTSFSILFPYKVNGKFVYTTQGVPAGVTVEVNANGVTSVNANLLPFKGAVRTSEKMGSGDLLAFARK